MTVIKKIFITLLLTSVLAIPASIYAQAPPSMPLLVYGNVQIDEAPAPEETVVSAYMGGTEIASTSISDEGSYFLNVPDGETNEDKIITFKVNNIEDEDTQCTLPNVDEVPTIKINLAVTTPEEETDDSGNNNTGGGSSGGGGTPTTDEEEDENETVGDIAGNDGVVDIMDFNTLMVNWGDSSSNSGADLDGNGRVDILDFNLLMVNWG